MFEKDGAVYVKADEATIKANRKTLNIKCSASGDQKVLVIGGYVIYVYCSGSVLMQPQWLRYPRRC